MPPELEAALPWTLGAFAIGLFISWLITWLSLSGSRARLEERIKAGERLVADFAARHAAACSDAAEHEANAQALRSQLAELRIRTEEEKRPDEGKQALLDGAEQRLAEFFKILSADMRNSSEQFLQHAKVALKAQAEEVKLDLGQHRAALEALLVPFAESVAAAGPRLAQLEQERGRKGVEIKSQMDALATVAAELGKLGSSLEATAAHCEALVKSAPQGGALPQIAAIGEPGGDFGFVPDPRQKALSVASDLRSALGD